MMRSKVPIAVIKYDYIIIIGIFIFSRLCIKIAGLEFESTAHRWCYQHLPPHLLKVSLIKSLWYLHMQPPFFNLLLGIGYKVFGNNDYIFFNTLFFLFSLLSVVCIYASFKVIGIYIWIRLLVALLLIASPSFILFGNILFYSMFVFCLLSVMLFALCGYAKNNNFSSCFKFLCLFSFAALLLMMTRSLFHIAWFIILSSVFLFFAYQEQGSFLIKKYFLPALIPTIALVLVLMLKNYLLFGVFQTSSWFGMNLSRIALDAVSEEKLDELYRNGKVSDFPLTVKKLKIPFHSLDKYGMKPGDIGSLPQHPALLWYLNSREYIYISKKLAKDSLTIILNEPLEYFKSVYKALKIFFNPTTEKARSFPEQYRYNNLWQPLYYPFHSNIIQIFAYIFVVIVSGSYTICALCSKKRNLLQYRYIAFFIFFTLVYFLFVATMFELGENNRFRFEILPLVLFGIPWSYSAIMEIKRIKNHNCPSSVQ